jgi:hypothetical protein
LDIQSFTDACEAYRRDNGVLPSDSQGLYGKDAYLLEQRVLDPWGNKYRYVLQSNVVAMESAGVDGQWSTIDDVCRSVPAGAKIHLHGPIEDETTRPEASPTVDRMALNPYPIFTKKAQRLKYPPGIDTDAYWGNGRFQIILRCLYDGNDGQNVLEKDIRAFRQDGCLVYFRTAAAYRILNLIDGSTQRITDLTLATPAQQELLRKLDSTDNANHVLNVQQ